MGIAMIHIWSRCTARRTSQVRRFWRVPRADNAKELIQSTL